MPRKIPIPSHLNGASFLSGDSDFHGLGRGRLRGRDVGHPFHGAYCVGIDLDSVLGLCRAFEPVMVAGQFFSHFTAALLFGVPLPEWVLPSPLHVVTLAARAATSKSAPRYRGVVGHVFVDVGMTTGLQIGLPVVGVADLWFQLASVLSREDLVAAGDYLISGRRQWGGSRQQPLATLAALEAAVARSARRRGTITANWALSRLRIDVDSRPESLLRLVLVAEGFPEPGINIPTLVDDGKLTLHADLTWREWKIVLEYEGEEHRLNKRRFRSDISRREKFETAGWRVIRVTADDLGFDREAFIARVHRVIRERVSIAM